MKKGIARAIYLLLFICFAMPFAYAKKPFEGQMKMRIAAPKFNGTAEFFLSEQGTRIEAKNEQIHQVMLIQPDAEVIYRLNLTEKTYSEMNLSETRRRSAALSRLKTYTIEKLGDEKLLGYTCSHFTISDGRLTLELWTSKELLDGESLKRLSAASQFLGVNEKMLEKMEENGVAGFPLKMKAQMQGRQVETELTDIQPKKLPASLFELSAEYMLQETVYSGGKTQP